MRLNLACGPLRVFAPVLLPLGLVASGALSAIATPLRSSLLLKAIAWACLAVYLGFKTGLQTQSKNAQIRKLCLITGVVFGLAQICERVANDRAGVSWARCLMPLSAYFILRSGIDSIYSHILQSNDGAGDRTEPHTGRLYLIITVSSAVALSNVFIRQEVVILGACDTLLTTLALVLLESLLSKAKQEHGFPDGNGHIASGGSRSRGFSFLGIDDHSRLVMRDVATTISVLCFVGSFALESHHMDSLAITPSVFHTENWNRGWRDKLFFIILGKDAVGILIEVTRCFCTFALVRRYSILNVVLLVLGYTILGRLIAGPTTLWEIWLALLYGLAATSLFDESLPSSVLFATSGRRMRTKQITSVLSAFSLLILFGKIFQGHRHYVHPSTPAPLDFPYETPSELLSPLAITDRSSHPIEQLINAADDQHDRFLARQSKTLGDAVREYRRRYGIPPPPHFDVWFEFARRNKVQYIDEFDSIYKMLQPFWGVSPRVLRDRVRESLGFDNFLIALSIRDGEASFVGGGGDDWQQKATVGMMKKFVQYLPDMDLAFNTHDEPRVVMPHELLNKLVTAARDIHMPAANSNPEPSNSFSARPSDLSDGKGAPPEVTTTRFNRFAHQRTWFFSRTSCPPDSPAMSIDDSPKDNITSYAYGDLAFVYNTTAFSDICQSPSLQSTFGFFERPNAFDVVQDLFPIFSQSKISSFQDILYPSPWYWAGRVTYEKEEDVEWDKKVTKLYWRGSTTGGFSRGGGWRRQHRQHMVRKMNANDKAKILANDGSPESPRWVPHDIQRREYGELMDVHFSHVGQCDDADCEAQKEFFQVTDRVEFKEAYGSKYVLDMDGNAFSGRFYAFLKSYSLPYKMAIFQEWHGEWIKPWVHYIPVSLRGDDWVEAVRYFADEKTGKDKAKKIADSGREWANKALRNEDMEVWFFRLLLEYGRLVDDNREKIGYGGP